MNEFCLTTHRALLRHTVLALAMSLGLSGAAFAQDAGQLGKALTPVGAEKAGNAAGTIPAWDGGLTKPLAGHKPGGHYADPFAADQPILTITAANAESQKDRLTPGQLALFKTYPSYKMVVFPTRRSAAFPQQYYDETMANPPRAKLAPGGNGVVGTTGGAAFPVPKDGTEAIWSALTRYRGDTYTLSWSQAAVARNGEFTPVRFEYEYDFQYGALNKKPAERADNLILFFLQTITAPARLAGQVLLVHEPIDQVRQPRTAWTYNPGQRRVRLAPNIGYDNPGTAADGLRTNDDFGIFAGATDRYDWKLVGKREIYIPYNSYKITGNTVKIADILKPNHLNQDLARYELHRVWVVDATLKAGISHIYSRRTFYLDEDSWIPALTDKYDGRGDLWRVGELHSINMYDVPMQYGTLEVHYDLQAGRYIAMGMRNNEPTFYETVKRTPGDYTPQNLRVVGTR
jgi:hypothetical protein